MMDSQASKIKNGPGKVFPNLGFETKTKTMSKSKLIIFAQMLGLIIRSKFSKVVKKHNTDKFSIGIDTWTHFVRMMFMQLAAVSSLRDISDGIRTASGNLNHLGVTQAPSKSSQTYRHTQRTHKVF